MWMTISMTMAACSLGLWGWWLGRPYAHEAHNAAVKGGLQRMFWPWVEALVPVLNPFISWRTRHRLDRLLKRAGAAETWSPPQFVAFQLIVGSVTGSLVFIVLTGVFAPAPKLVVAALSAAVAAFWPIQRFRERVRLRRLAMARAFPFLLDMVTLCVEAGLNLHGALQQTASHGPAGPLRDELQHMLADIRAGATRSDALHRWAVRCDLPAMHYFVSAVAQADQFGMSLGPVLRAQADQRRAERFMQAERLAQEAPVKMMFPLVFCIFPCSFAIIAFPIAVQFMASLQ